MKQILVLSLIFLPTLAAANDAAYGTPSRIQVIAPSDVASNASTQKPATDAEIMELIDALNIKESLRASVEGSAPLVRQSYNDLLNKTMKEQGVRLPEQQIQALSQRIAEKHNKLKAAMFDWMLEEYVRRHKATYTQADTLQILAFMKSPVGRKYIQSDSKTWAGILTDANAEFAKLIPATVAQAFREAGALR